jgi:hypothetical protein
VTNAATNALAERFGDADLDGKILGHTITATK